MYIVIFSRWLDSNSVPLILGATTMPTEPQPMPKVSNQRRPDWKKTIEFALTAITLLLYFISPVTSQSWLHMASFAVWPDWAIFKGLRDKQCGQIWQNFTNLATFYESLSIFEPTLANLLCFGQPFKVVHGLTLKNNIDIWLHWSD